MIYELVRNLYAKNVRNVRNVHGFFPLETLVWKNAMNQLDLSTSFFVFSRMATSRRHRPYDQTGARAQMGYGSGADVYQCSQIGARL